MRKEEFVMRGQTASRNTGASPPVLGEEILNFSGFKPGYAYKLTEFNLYPSTNVISQNAELCGSITAGKAAIDPTNPNFNNDALIATSCLFHGPNHEEITTTLSVVNDTFLVTQNLILAVRDSQNNPINWECRFKPVKMAKAEETVANYKQFTISDE